jgi:hypothetical protein
MGFSFILLPILSVFTSKLSPFVLTSPIRTTGSLYTNPDIQYRCDIIASEVVFDGSETPARGAGSEIMNAPHHWNIVSHYVWDNRIPTFTHITLAYKPPQHVRTMVTVRRLMESLLYEKMTVSRVEFQVIAAVHRRELGLRSSVKMIQGRRHLGNRAKSTPLNLNLSPHLNQYPHSHPPQESKRYPVFHSCYLRIVWFRYIHG